MDIAGDHRPSFKNMGFGFRSQPCRVFGLDRNRPRSAWATAVSQRGMHKVIVDQGLSAHDVSIQIATQRPRVTQAFSLNHSSI
jgi:hypothetical protein